MNAVYVSCRVFDAHQLRRNSACAISGIGMGGKRKSNPGAGDGSASKKLALRDGDDGCISAECRKVVNLVVSWMLGAYVPRRICTDAIQI